MNYEWIRLVSTQTCSETLFPYQKLFISNYIMSLTFSIYLKYKINPFNFKHFIYEIMIFWYMNIIHIENSICIRFWKML